MSPRPLSVPRRLAFGLLVTVLVLGGVECSLRLAGAVVVSQQRGAPMQGVAIWAFGDSYTFGIGATDPALESYPAVTARLVTEATGATVSVRNFALPGLNSTRVVASLRAALADGPAPVCPPPRRGQQHALVGPVWSLLPRRRHPAAAQGSAAVADLQGVASRPASTARAPGGRRCLSRRRGGVSPPGRGASDRGGRAIYVRTEGPADQRLGARRPGDRGEPEGPPRRRRPLVR